MNAEDRKVLNSMSKQIAMMDGKIDRLPCGEHHAIIEGNKELMDNHVKHLNEKCDQALRLLYAVIAIAIAITVGVWVA